MKFKSLTILLPCHSLEDFPIHHEGDDALGLLVAWTSMWHPAMLLAAQSMPAWARADDPPQDLADRLLLVPGVSESLLLAGWAARAKNEGACLIRRPMDRAAAIQEALAALEGGDRGIPPDVAADFLALGYAYLEEELLTRQMRYMSNLDERHFQTQVLLAAAGAAKNDAEQTRTHLQACFDVLAEARERFYPAEAFLVDLTLVSTTTMGAALRQELAGAGPLNLLCSGDTLRQMATREPQTVAALKEAVATGKATLVGGELSETELPLLPPEAILDELHRGSAAYRETLGHAPEIFGRRRFGLTPLLPQVLSRLGFIGALHATLDDGAFPRAGQSKARWEGIGSASIDVLAKIPLEVTAPQTFLSLCSKLSETMDHDHVATVVFARWPGQTSPWYDDLQRIARFSPVLGKFVSLKDYFTKTASSGTTAKFPADQYRSPYLKQGVIRRQPRPLTTMADKHRRRAVIGQEQVLTTLAALLRGRRGEESASLAAAVDLSVPDTPEDKALDDKLHRALEARTTELASSLPRAGAGAAGHYVFNTLSTSRRLMVDVESASDLPALGGEVKAVQDDRQKGGRCSCVVEVPPLGYVWLPSAAGPAAAPEKAVKLADSEETVLRNEFFEVHLDPATGGIRALYDYIHRGNRLSQQLGMRSPGQKPAPGDSWRDPDEMAEYSVMAAESIDVTSEGPAFGEIVSRGVLKSPEGKRLAGFRQTLRLARGSRILEIEGELDVTEEPRADPWNSYYAARFAWSDEEAEIFRSVGFTTQPTEARRVEAPLFVEARSPKKRLAFLCGGLPYHRLVGDRMLDTLLVVRGESRRTFRLGVAVDALQPMQEALAFLHPPVVVRDTRGAPRGPAASWLFHLDAKNVVPTYWSPLCDESGQVVGYRARWQETEGRAIRAKLRSFKKPVSACQVDFHGQTLVQLPIEDDAVLIDFSAFEWIDVEARFE
ncbi:MAG: hypothetical protein HYS13_04170 [Planctomycetia bacterium]|nr:hypothetical protein [Planctomycetia bacterium]